MSEATNVPAPRAAVSPLDSTVGLVAAVAAALAGAASLVEFGVGARGVIGAAFCAVLIVLSAFDLEQRRLPNVIVLPSIAAVLIAQLAFFPDHALEWVGAGIGAGVLLFLPRLFTAEAIGMGDVKLAMLLGVGLGGEVITACLIGSLAAVPVALGILITEGAAGRKKAIPLAPFLALGGVLALFLGELPT